MVYRPRSGQATQLGQRFPIWRRIGPGLDIRGLGAWQALVARVLDGEAFGAFEEFLGTTAPLRRKPKPARLFISHQQNDAAWADRIFRMPSPPRTASTTGSTSTTRR